MQGQRDYKHGEKPGATLVLGCVALKLRFPSACRSLNLRRIDTFHSPAYIPKEMIKSTFGDRLRREREMRGVSLEEISTATRIGTRFLEALESEQWDRLPGGVFNRGFVRAVARFLGLDEEDLVAEYDLATKSQPEAPLWTTKPSPLPERNWRPLIVAAMGIVLVGVAWFGWTRYGSILWRWAVANPSAGHSAANPSPSETLTAPAPLSDRCDPQQLELKVDALQAVEVTIPADGKEALKGQMQPSLRRVFCAQDSFDVSAMNSTALMIELNGQVQLLPALPGQPGEIRLTRESLKKDQGGRD